MSERKPGQDTPLFSGKIPRKRAQLAAAPAKPETGSLKRYLITSLAMVCNCMLDVPS